MRSSTLPFTSLTSFGRCTQRKGCSKNIEMEELKTFSVTMNEKTYVVKDWNVDGALCTAYRKYHFGKVNVYDHILWHLGCTKEQVTWREL